MQTVLLEEEDSSVSLKKNLYYFFLFHLVIIWEIHCFVNVVHLTFFVKGEGELRRLATQYILNSVYTNLVIQEGWNVQLEKKTTADELPLVLQSICLSRCCASVRQSQHISLSRNLD